MHHFGLWDYSVSDRRAAPVSLERLALPFLAFTNPLRRFTMNNFCSEQQVHLLPKTTVFLTLVMVLFFTLAGCGGGSSALVGTWVPEAVPPRTGPSGIIELSKDGTGILSNKAMTWKTKNNRVYFITPTRTTVFDYKISGSTLTITADDGKNITYKRK